MREIEFDLDWDWAKANWTGYCAVTNIPFTKPSERNGREKRSFFPSIDRIDPKKGYTKDNCRFVLWAVNALKNDGTDEEMRLIASHITNP